MKIKDMNIQPLIIGILALLVIVGLSGCNSPKQSIGKTPEELIIGNWYTEIEGFGMNFIFYENHSVCGIVQGTSVWSEYNITSNKINFKNSDGTVVANDYSFSDNYQKLTISDYYGGVMIFTKQ